MTALEYHEATKHYFNRFARSTGYLDWATQPDPFRRFPGAALRQLPRDPVAASVPYDPLFDGSAPPLPFDLGTVAELLRCAMGLSAWKQYQSNRWALRVNPSSGNLHPTEAYIVWNGRVCHYASREHALEERCVFAGRGLLAPAGEVAGRMEPASNDQRLLVGLTSIFWREAWKYGERAFRYCQHDLGHAIGAMRLSAARLGWQMQLLTDWSDADIASLLGVDRADDFANAEREFAECVALITKAAPSQGGLASRAMDSRSEDPVYQSGIPQDPADEVDRYARERLIESARDGTWSGRANRLSGGHVEWPVIDAVASATTCPGGLAGADRVGLAGGQVFSAGIESDRTMPARPTLPARRLLLQRRSAVGFDGRSTLPVAAFGAMLSRLRPSRCPWDSVPWPPHVHLALFVHRVDGLAPGIYAFLRDPSAAAEWRSAMRPQFIWEAVAATAGALHDGELHFLLPFDMTWPATRVSCDQDIAGEGFFSLAMIGRVGSSLRTRGDWFYRRLFWEAGLIGQVLYLEAEAAGARGTGIGCYYDDAVHELLGLKSATDESRGAGEFDARHAEWQSLYHFSMGQPVDDARLSTEAGYEWERDPLPN